MKSSAITATLALAASLAVSSVDAATVAKDCTQDQRTFINTLLQQDKNPYQSCAARARGDIQTLSTSRLCPITECKVWIEYMAEKAPDCVYDDTNYGASFLAKAKDCGSTIGDGSAVGNDAGATTPSPAGNSTTPTPTPTSKAPSAGSRGSRAGSKDDDDDNTIEAPTSSIPTVTVPETPEPTTRAPVTAPPSGAAALSVVASLSAVVLSVAALAL